MKAVLVGAGMVADTHVAALADLRATVALSGIIARSKDKNQKFVDQIAQTYALDVQTFSSVAECLAIGKPDFAIIATPPDARQDLIEELSAQGVHILTEKPLERNLAAARQIVATCESHNVRLGVCLQHRMRDDVALLRNHITQGGLGQITHLEICVPWWRDQSYYDAPGRGTYGRDGGGVMINQAIHTLDLALSFMGPVEAVQAMMTTTPSHAMEAEDWATAALRFRSGAVASVYATTAAFPGGSETIAFHGTAGAAHLQPGNLTLIDEAGKITEHGSVSASGGGADPMAFTHEWHRNIINDFASAIGSDRAPAVTGVMALEVHRVIDAMERSSTSGRRINI